SSPGRDGLRYSHLDIALRSGGLPVEELLAELTALWHQLFDNAVAWLPEDCGSWRRHTSANLMALEVKAQPIAVGNTLRRHFASTFSQNWPYLDELLQDAGQFGMGVSGGVEIVPAVARFIHESGEWLLSLDAANAFNSI
ncbi:unnamed protein product, partial [Phaeothamnion confervicola]